MVIPAGFLSRLDQLAADGLTAHHLKILLRPDGEALREVRYLG